MVLEQQRRELMQAAPPGLPLVSRVGRHIEVTVYAGGFERFGIGLGVAAEASAAASAIATQFTAAVADEQHLDLLLEGGQVGDIRTARCCRR